MLKEKDHSDADGAFALCLVGGDHWPVLMGQEEKNVSRGDDTPRKPSNLDRAFTHHIAWDERWNLCYRRKGHRCKGPAPR